MWEFRVVKSVAIPHKVFGTSLHVVGGSRALVLFTLVLVILRIVVPNTHCVLLLFCLSSSCVFYAASFSWLSIRYFVTFMYTYLCTKSSNETSFLSIFLHILLFCFINNHVCHFPINTVNLKYVNLRPYIFKVGCKFLMYRRCVYVVFVFLLFHLRIECIFCSFITVLKRGLKHILYEATNNALNSNNWPCTSTLHCDLSCSWLVASAHVLNPSCFLSFSTDL